MTIRGVLICAVLFVAGIYAWGCLIENPDYCPMHPEDTTCPHRDAGAQCDDDRQCSGATAVCDKDGSKTCVQCTLSETQACTGTTPTCMDNQCHGCTVHSQCGSNVCLPDG